MNVEDFKDRVMQKITNRAEEILIERAKTFKELLKYETSVTNTELAMRSEAHGYDFEFISQTYADSAVFHPIISSDNKLELKMIIPQHVFKNASDEEIEFFKTFIVANAAARLKQMN